MRDDTIGFMIDFYFETESVILPKDKDIPEIENLIQKEVLMIDDLRGEKVINLKSSLLLKHLYSVIYKDNISLESMLKRTELFF